MNKMLLFLLIGVPLAGIMISPFNAGQRANEAQERRRVCVESNGSQTEIAGRIAIAGSGYYLLEGEKWRFLMLRCNPASSRCSKASPAQKALEKHAGKPSRAKVCAGEIAQFEIAGQWFGR